MTKDQNGNTGTANRFLSVPQAAEELNKSTRSVWRLVQSGELSVHRLGGSTRIARTDLEAYIARNRR